MTQCLASKCHLKIHKLSIWLKLAAKKLKLIFKKSAKIVVFEPYLKPDIKCVQFFDYAFVPGNLTATINSYV